MRPGRILFGLGGPAGFLLGGAHWIYRQAKSA
jgi:hypothetical protein